MSWETLIDILTFIFAIFFIVLVVLGIVIVLVAILVGAVKAFRAALHRSDLKRSDNDPMI
jgi:heme/copper-type cytochrome/quinol oxidase subunit 2